MKRIFALLLTLALALSLAACGSAPAASGGSFSAAASGSQENQDGASSSGEAASSAADPARSDPEPTPAQVWEVQYYVDDFNQPTDDGFVTNKNYFVGQFSNSATTNSQLYVQVLADGTDVVFFLYEYGSHQVKNSSSNYVDTYSITMRTGDGTDHALTGTLYCGGDRVYVDDACKASVIDALSQADQQVSFLIVDDKYSTTKYLFTVDCGNFAEAYQELTQG